MGKEAKIGMAVIFTLLMVFGVVLFRRLNGMPKGPLAEAADAKAATPSRQSPEIEQPGSQAEALPAAAPKIVSATSGADELSQGSRAAGLDDWTVVHDDKESDPTESQPDSGPPSPFPMLVGATSEEAHAAPAVSPTAPAPGQELTGYGASRQQAPGVGQPSRPTAPQVAQRPGPFTTNTLLNSVRNTDPEAQNDPYAPEAPQNPLREQAGGTVPPQAAGGYPYHNSPGRYQNGTPYPPPGYPSSYRSTYRTSPEVLQAPSPYQASSSPYHAGGFGRPVDVGRPLAEDGSYLVQPNDNYWTISQRLYGTGAYFRALAEHNRRRCPDADQLRPGEKISAPSVAELEKSYRDLCPKPEHRDVAAQRVSMVSTASRLGGGRVYVVQEGDTLFDIARYELGKASRWADIFQLNRDALGDQYDYLTPGMQLILPVDQPAEQITRQPGTPLRR